jgi:hypothetical protein
LRLATGYAKNIRFAFRFCGINRSACLPSGGLFIPQSKIFFPKILLFQNPVSRPGCYDLNERGVGWVLNFKNILHATQSTFTDHDFIMANTTIQKMQSFQILTICLGNFPTCGLNDLSPCKKTYT